VKVDFEKKLGDFYLELCILSPFASVFYRNENFFSLASRFARRASKRKSKIEKQSLRRSGRSFSARSSQPSIERSIASVDLIAEYISFARRKSIARERGGVVVGFFARKAQTRSISSDFVFIFDFPRNEWEIFFEWKKSRSNLLCACVAISSSSSLFSGRNQGEHEREKKKKNNPNKKR
jgi:hypothetical protein